VRISGLNYHTTEGSETTRHIKWSQSEIMINNLKFEMGPLSSIAEFCLEDNIDSIAEIGYDGWCVNGKMTNGQIWGLEVKDCGYVGKASNYSEIPTPVKLVNDKFSAVLQKYNHTGFYSTEVRYCKDGKTYYTDPCVRSGSPPSNVYMKMVSNWSEIIDKGTQGILVEPKFTAKYGCEIILKSNYCNGNTLPVIIPDEFKENVALKGAYHMDGKDYIIPFLQAGIKDMESFGSVVVVGDNLDEIMNKAVEIANSIDAPGLYFAENALEKAKETLNELKNNINVEF